jgi:hypothetical protein
MNSLSLGFLYLVGLSWLLCEVCVSASGGNWTPLWLYLIGFTVMFAILGCLPLSTKAIETAGPIFSFLIGAWILLYAFAAFDAGIAGGMLRLVLGLGMIGLGAMGLMTRKSEEAH